MKFNQKVYNLVKKIKKGKISTYSSITKKLNSKAYQAVGNALNKNNSKSIPCHRVINSNGNIGGFNKGVKNKIKLLKEEGIRIKNNKINLNQYLYKF